MGDLLFLLRPNFYDAKAGTERFYCPGCAAIMGVLAYYPELRARLEVCEVDFPRPRAEVAAALGPDHPGCPVLVLGSSSAPPADVPVKIAPTGRRYVLGVADIQRYLAAVYHVGSPHP